MTRCTTPHRETQNSIQLSTREINTVTPSDGGDHMWIEATDLSPTLYITSLPPSRQHLRRRPWGAGLWIPHHPPNEHLCVPCGQWLGESPPIHKPLLAFSFYLRNYWPANLSPSMRIEEPNCNEFLFLFTQREHPKFTSLKLADAPSRTVFSHARQLAYINLQHQVIFCREADIIGFISWQKAGTQHSDVYCGPSSISMGRTQEKKEEPSIPWCSRI